MHEFKYKFTEDIKIGTCIINNDVRHKGFFYCLWAASPLIETITIYASMGPGSNLTKYYCSTRKHRLG